ncbi:hypothetical protein BH09GEM1_BH09GEM1_41300 [soil metagenome]
MTEPSPETRAPSAFSNAMLMSAGEVASRAVGFVATAYISRRLGPAGFGLVGFASAFTAYFGLFVTGGMANMGGQTVARDPGNAPALVAGVALVRGAFAVLLFAALYLAVGLVSLSQDERLLIRLYGLILFTLALDVSWAYKGLERGGRVAVAVVAGQVCMLAAVLVLVRSPADVRWVPISQFMGEVIAAAILLLPLAVRARHVAMAAALRLLRAAAVPGITRILRTLIFTFDVLLLGFLGLRADLGLYTAAYRICLLVAGIQAALHSSFWAAGARADSPASLGKVVTRAIGLAGAVGLPMIAGGIVLGRPLMSLFFGSAFAPGASMLGWLLVGTGCVLAHGAYTLGLIAAGDPRRDLVIMAAAAVFNVVANIIVVPRYGAIGASVVTAGSEAVALILCIFTGRAKGWGVRFRVLVPSAAAAAAMAMALLLVRDRLEVLFCIVVGGAVYASVLLLVGVPEDARPLVASVTRRLAALRTRAS